MRKQKNNLRYLHWALPCILLFSGCESSDNGDLEPVELQVAPVVATTRSAIQAATSMGTVAVYATGTDDDYTDVNSNNYAVYTWSGSSWGNSGATRIYLTNETATIYGYYPTTTKYDANLNISVTLLESGTIAAVDNATGTLIASDTDEVDCMWANKVENVSNASGKNNVTLTMNHALSMVSFQVYKDASYKGAGNLTEFVVKNVAGSHVLSKGTSPKMNITTGALTPGVAVDATYTRTITGYTLADTKDAAKKLSILVLPISSIGGDDKIEATFTVDNAVYPVNLKAPISGGWVTGSNHLYTVKLSGTEASISQVTVTKWTEVAGGNLDIK